MKEADGASLDALDVKRHPSNFSAVSAARSRAADFFALTKPRLNFLVVITAGVGYYLGASRDLSVLKLVEGIAGTALVAGGAAGLNQVYERETDGLMWRTRKRPVAAGRLTVKESTIFSLALSAAGLAMLATSANLLAAGLALLTLISYNVVYTPMKRRSQLATLVGAVPGALPPMIGWAAATHTLSVEGWLLVGIVFLWQMPHFLAIAWMYRDDYARAGIPLLPVLEPDGRRTGQQALLYAAVLWPVSLLPVISGLAGIPYALIATVLGFFYIGLSVRFAQDRSPATARRLFLFSIIYLTLLLGALVANRVWL